MALTVTKRPSSPASSQEVINGSITGSLSPWYNIGEGTGWVFNSDKARCTITSGNSRRLRQDFNAKSGLTYDYSFEVTNSSVGAFTIFMAFRKKDGTGQTIRSVAAVNGVNTYSGTVVANNDYDYVEFMIVENIP